MDRKRSRGAHAADRPRSVAGTTVAGLARARAAEYAERAGTAVSRFRSGGRPASEAGSLAIEDTEVECPQVGSPVAGSPVPGSPVAGKNGARGRVAEEPRVGQPRVGDGAKQRQAGGEVAGGTRTGESRAGESRAGEEIVGPTRAGARLPGRLRPSLSRPRIVVAVVVVGLLVVGLAVGWAAPRPSAEPTVQAFLLDWENGQYRAAAALTTGDRPAVTAALGGAYRQLGAAAWSLAMGPISQHGDNATAAFDASVDLGRGGPPWTYQGRFNLRETGGTWKVAWSPSVIAPGLSPGLRLAVVTTMPPRALLLDAAGRSLIRRAPVVVVGVRPGRLAHPRVTADAFAAAAGLDASQVRDEIVAAPDAGFLELVRLSPASYHRLSHRLSKVTGLIIRPERLRLFDSIAAPVTGSVGTETAQVLRADGVPYRPGTTIGESGLQLVYQRRLIGTPTTEVVAEGTGGRVISVLRRWPGQGGVPVRTTISSRVQLAADQALSTLPGSAAIAAVTAGSGRILAVAEHTGRGMPAVQVLDGRYRPGQAFTIVSTAALLSTGFRASTTIPCLSANPVGGETFTNDPPESNLGRQWQFSTDFADACGTAFAGLSLNLDANKLVNAAKGFGLGAPWRLPLGSFAGSIRTPVGEAQLAEDTIGGGSVRVSPLQMALIAAVVASGTWHPPQLVTSPADPGLTPRVPFGTQVVSELRTLMRGAVASGAGRAADVGGGSVYGQVGSAPLGQGKELRATWFVGFQQDVAFAVFEMTRSARTSAAPLAGAFLRALHGAP